MKRLVLYGWVVTAALAAPVVGEGTARALISDNDVACPPDPLHVCQGESIKVDATTAERVYRGSGFCWFNMAANKADTGKQQWARIPVRFDGRFLLQSDQFTEELVFLPPGAPESRFIVRGMCPDDPWATGSSCNMSTPKIDFCSKSGWCCAPRPLNGPLSRVVFPPGLISGLLQKQLSKPPLAPVDLDVVRWPAFDGSGSIGRVFWRVPDVSGNKWIFNFIVEYAINSGDSAFSNAGQVTGTGETANLSPSQVSRMYYSTFKLQPGDYYFRVCSANDAGKQCSAPLKAREPTKAELMAVEHSFHRANITLSTGPTPPAAPPGAPPRGVSAPPPVVGLPPRQAPMPPGSVPR